jgi:AcrR family transcriptional regulator
MNTKNNQRYQDTHRKIQKVTLAMLNNTEFRSITVLDICKAARVNRSTFYLHYLDIYDLMDQIDRELQQGIMQMYKGMGTDIEHFLTKESLEMIVRYVGEHKDFYRAYMNDFGKNTLARGFEIVFKEYFVPYFKKLGMQSESEMMYHFAFFQAGFTTVIKRWLDMGCIESPQDLTRILWESIPKVPPELLESTAIPKQ